MGKLKVFISIGDVESVDERDAFIAYVKKIISQQYPNDDIFVIDYDADTDLRVLISSNKYKPALSVSINNYCDFIFAELLASDIVVFPQNWKNDQTCVTNMEVCKLLNRKPLIIGTDLPRITTIISAFPATGKSFITDCWKLFKCSDSDSSRFSWLYDEHGEKNGRNPNFINDYISHIKSRIGKDDIVFVSSHEDIRSELYSSNIKFHAVIPTADQKDAYVGRCVMRGSNLEFCKLIGNNYNKWTNDIARESSIGMYPVHMLKNNMYISNVIKEIFE